MLTIGQDENMVCSNFQGKISLCEFASTREAEVKARFVQTMIPWVGTPFVDCADIPGPKGGVDCAMLLVRGAVDSGLLPPFDPRPYSPNWLLHRGEEKFIEWIKDKLGAREVESPRFGDVCVYFFGRCFAHGAVMVADNMVLHAYKIAGMTMYTKMDDTTLSYMPIGNKLKRPVRYFDVWKG